MPGTMAWPVLCVVQIKALTVAAPVKPDVG
jgi:hypothetical protein